MEDPGSWIQTPRSRIRCNPILTSSRKDVPGCVRGGSTPPRNAEAAAALEGGRPLSGRSASATAAAGEGQPPRDTDAAAAEGVDPPCRCRVISNPMVRDEIPWWEMWDLLLAYLASTPIHKTQPLAASAKGGRLLATPQV